MLQIWADEVFSIGTVAGVLQPVVVSDRLRNIPEKGIYNWDPGAFFGIYKPDQFWFDRAAGTIGFGRAPAGAAHGGTCDLQRRRPRIGPRTASASDARHGVGRVRTTVSMLSYIVHRMLIMIPTLIAISIVIFTIINLPPGNYFTTYIAELQGSGETADLAKIEFLEERIRLRPPAVAAISLLGRRAAARRYGLFVLLRSAGQQGGRRPHAADRYRLDHHDHLHLYRRVSDRGLFGDASVQLERSLR